MKLLIVDDHQVFTQGLIFLFENHFKNAQILSATNAQNALGLIEENSDIDLLIIDIGLPEINGCAFIQLLKEKNIILPTCVISATDDIQQIHQILDLGAMGFIPKEWGSEKITQGVDKILQGQIVIPEDIQQKVHTFNQIQNRIVLSKRQKDVLVLLKDGLSNQQISKLLNISENTVKSHVSALFQLFEAKNRMACVENAKKFHTL